jgi:hypothetical protein
MSAAAFFSAADNHGNVRDTIESDIGTVILRQPEERYGHVDWAKGKMYQIMASVSFRKATRRYPWP